MDIINLIYVLILGIVASASYITGKLISKGKEAMMDNEILKKYDKIQVEKISKEDIYKEEKWTD